MLRQVVLMTCLLAAAPAVGQSQRSNGLEGLSERIQRDYDDAMARSRNREIVTSPLPPRTRYAPSAEEQRMDEMRYRIERLETESARRRNWF